MQKDHLDALNKEKEQINLLTESIGNMRRDNSETMKQIVNDGDQEIQEMQMKNQTNLN